jgi:high-affinity nickel-transport protein
MANFNINVAGFCIAGLFVAVWAAALAYWRWGDVEARWSSGLSAACALTPEPTITIPHHELTGADTLNS